MASLTIGGQDRPLRLTATGVKLAERRILKRGPASPRDVADPKEPFLAIDELEALVLAAWTPALDGGRRARPLLAQYYVEGGTLFELHTEVIDALIDCGLLGRRAADEWERAPRGPSGGGDVRLIAGPPRRARALCL